MGIFQSRPHPKNHPPTKPVEKEKDVFSFHSSSSSSSSEGEQSLNSSSKPEPENPASEKKLSNPQPSKKQKSRDASPKRAGPAYDFPKRRSLRLAHLPPEQEGSIEKTEKKKTKKPQRNLKPISKPKQPSSSSSSSSLESSAGIPDDCGVPIAAFGKAIHYQCLPGLTSSIMFYARPIERVLVAVLVHSKLGVMDDDFHPTCTGSVEFAHCFLNLANREISGFQKARFAVVNEASHHVFTSCCTLLCYHTCAVWFPHHEPFDKLVAIARTYGEVVTFENRLDMVAAAKGYYQMDFENDTSILTYSHPHHDGSLGPYHRDSCPCTHDLNGIPIVDFCDEIPLLNATTEQTSNPDTHEVRTVHKFVLGLKQTDWPVKRIINNLKQSAENSGHRLVFER